MGLASRLKATVRNLLRKQEIERDLDDEVRAYGEMLTEEKLVSGVAPHDARRTALAECGGLEQVKQAVREQRAGAGIETVAQDLRYALRQMRRSPGFTALAVLTLAVGIGANTAIFSFVNAVLLRPLPYPDADRLQIVLARVGNSNRAPASNFELFHFRLRTREFEQVAGIWVTNGALPGEGDAEPVKVGVVTANFLPLLCPRPALGRFFSPEDDIPDAPQTIVISHGVWARRFGSDPGVIGQSVRFGNHRAVVVGVLPEDFRLIFPNDSSVPANVEVFNTTPIDGSDPEGPSYLHLIGRLRTGSSTFRAQAEAESIAKQINSLNGRTAYQNFGLTVFPLQADDVRDVRRTLLLLFGGVGLVLLIGCANIANLLMARARQRRHETTIRAALGASHLRLARQLLTESLLLGCIGAVAAVGVGWAAVRGILALRPSSLANFGTVTLDLRVLGFTLAVAIITSVLFGLAPVAAMRGIDLAEGLKKSASPAGWKRRNWATALVSCEVSLAFVLLLGTGLLVRSYVNTLNVDPGFRSDHVFTFRLFGVPYATLHQLQQNLATLPGVDSVGAVSHLPLDDTGNWYDYYWKQGAPNDQQNTVMADHRSILPGYFATIRASLIAGRDFTSSDDPAHQHVAIIDDLLARELWPGESALGRRINISDSPAGPYQFQRDWAIVVGVVKHIRCHSLTAIVRPQIYVPFQLAPRPTVNFVLHTVGAQDNLSNAVRAEVAKLNKYAPVSHVEPLSTVEERAVSEIRFASLLATLLSSIALLLACIGIYGVLSYSVVLRTSEIGIRMAIGAPRERVMRMVLADCFASVLPGLVGGFLLSLLLTPMLTRLLFEIKPGNAGNYATILAVVLAVSFFAALLPARRAMKIDPLKALRYE